ncbi:MAG: oligosaccharide flippase family protein [Gemmatimonadetes bacterium]|nr:oligosaccharide flippase family protein [Gemmatimonadota bacterium]
MANTSSSLDRTLVQGIAWTGAIRWTAQSISWAATFVIARLLTPTDYGLVGMAMIYVGLAQIVTEGGVSAAVVQQRDLTADQVAQLNGLAVMIGVMLFALTLALAAPISWFFGERQVHLVITVVSTIFLIRSVQVVPRALLARDLDFRRLAWIDGLETFSLMLTTLLLALAHFGFWALCLGALVSGVLTSSLALRWRAHPMKFPRTLGPIKRPVSFAWQVVTSQLAWYTYSNGDFAVVGRVLGKAALGAYSFAWTIASVPVDRVSSLVSRVTPAFFAAVQHDPPALRRYLLNLTEGLAVVTLPACIGLAIVAPEFVHVVLGDAWTAAIVPLRLLSLYAAFRSIITPAPTILVATGRSKLSMYFSLLSAVILPIAFYIGTRWGTTGVAMGWLLVYPMLAIGLFLRSAFRVIGMSAREYLRALAPALGATAAMTVVLLLLRLALPAGWPPLARLLLQVLVGAAAYSAVIYARHRERLRAVHALIRGRADGRSGDQPVHDTGDRPEADRLLLITYHFPPDPAVGALRWRKLARYAAERGWALDVIAAHPASLTGTDAGALDDLPPGVRIFGVPVETPAFERVVDAAWFVTRRLVRKGVAPSTGTPQPTGPRRESLGRDEMKWWPRERRDVARAYFAAVEHVRYHRWARDAARLALKILDPQRHRAVITCGPPHPAHEAGVRISRQTGLPLVVDLRDPWSLVQRLPEAIASPLRLLLSTQGERRAVKQAALVVANTPGLRNAMCRAYPSARNRIIAVPNGFDDDRMPPSPPGRTFTVAYAGSIYLDRDPRWLFQGAARLARELDLTPADFQMEFMGNVKTFDGVPLDQMAREAGVAELVRLRPAASRAEALEFLARAKMLVVLPQDSDLAIPAKLFDYARFDAWVLAFAERGSATELMLQETAADVVRPGDLEGLYQVLHQRYLQHLRGEGPTRLAADDRLSRRTQANLLFGALEEIVGAPRRPAPEVAASAPQLSSVPV